jgi:hypothetical protein
MQTLLEDSSIPAAARAAVEYKRRRLNISKPLTQDYGNRLSLREIKECCVKWASKYPAIWHGECGESVLLIEHARSPEHVATLFGIETVELSKKRLNVNLLIAVLYGLKVREGNGTGA